MITRYVECTIQKNKTNQNLAAWDFTVATQRAFEKLDIIYPTNIQVGIPKDSKNKIYVKIEFDDTKYKRQSPTDVVSLGEITGVDELIDDTLGKSLGELQEHCHFIAFESERNKAQRVFEQTIRQENKISSSHIIAGASTKQYVSKISYTAPEQRTSPDILSPKAKSLTRTKASSPALTRENLQALIKEMSKPNYDSDNESIKSNDSWDSDDSLNYEDARPGPHKK